MQGCDVHKLPQLRMSQRFTKNVDGTGRAWIFHAAATTNPEARAGEQDQSKTSSRASKALLPAALHNGNACQSNLTHSTLFLPSKLPSLQATL